MKNNKMNQELNVKAADFSVVQSGERFYLSKIAAADSTPYYIKTETTRTKDGTWSNTKNEFGLLGFVKYDSRVWVRK